MTTRRLFHGTLPLVRFVWRTDRLKLIIWIAALTATTVAIAVSFPGLYPTELERQILAETMRNPAMTAMLGPGYALDDYTPGAMMAHEMLLFTALAVAVMNILLVIRSTRADEQAGRLEMVRSLPVGRLSAPAATMIVLVAANVALTLIVTLTLVALGIDSIDWSGSLMYGAALGATGVAFAAITLLCAQLTATSRGALSYAFGLLGGAYLLRAVGDVSAEWMSLISPLGLVLRTQAFVNNYWWPVFVLVVAAGLIAAAALYLNAMRDLGAGLLPDRPGPTRASRRLLNPIGGPHPGNVPLGLALRLQRTALIGWGVAMLLVGVSYGSVFGDLEAFFESTEIIRQLLPDDAGTSLTMQFASMVTAVMAMLGAVPAMMMVFKLKGEEDARRTEQLLAGAVSRTDVMGSYIALAVIAAVIVPVVSAVGLGLAAIPVMDDPIPIGKFIGAGLAYTPAILAMVGLSSIVVGFVPRLVIVPWLYLAFTFFVVYLGPLLRMPEWTGRLSPFGYIPQLPVDSFQVVPVVGVGALAVVLLITGLAGYRKRDVHG